MTHVQNRRFFDVRDYGAKCDGITDDTVAVKAAFDAAIQDATNYEGGEICVRFHGATLITGEVYRSPSL